MGTERDDVDAALDSLEAELLVDASADIREVDEAAPASPPELPSRSAGSGRHSVFDDLVAADNASASALHGNPDEKIETLRGRLRHAEAAMARVREAWDLREREVGNLEQALDEAQQRAEEAGHKRAAFEQFFETKKKEFTEYIEGVTRAFAEKDEVEKSLRSQIAALRQESAAHGEELRRSRDDLRGGLDAAGAELERARAQVEELRQEVADTRSALGHEIEVRDEALAKLKRMVQVQRAAVSERDATIEQQMDTVEERERATARLLAEKETLERALQSKAVENEHQALAELRATHARDVGEQEAALERARASLEQSKRELRLRDATIAELHSDLDTLSHRVTQAEADRAASQQQNPADENGAAHAELAQRDETIATLRAAVEEQLRAAAERELKIETLEVQAAEARRDALRAAEQAMQQPAPGGTNANVKTVRLKKALHLADRLFFDLESGHPTLFQGRDGTGEMLARLRKAVALARKAAEMI
jgi:hypothetical protein